MGWLMNWNADYSNWGSGSSVNLAFTGNFGLAALERFMTAVLEISLVANGFIKLRSRVFLLWDKYSRSFELFVQRFHDC